MLMVCDQLGIPVASEKLEGPPQPQTPWASSGRNCSPSWLLPAHGVTSELGYAPTSIVKTSPFPSLGKTVHETARIHAIAPNPVLSSSPAQLHHPHSRLSGRLNSIADALYCNILPLLITLTTQAYTRPTPTPHHLAGLPSPTPTGQSCSPIYGNYTIGIRHHQDFCQSFQAPRRWSLSLPPTLSYLCNPRPSVCVVESLFCTTPWCTEAPSPGTPC